MSRVLLALVLVLSSCSKDEIQEPKFSLSVSQDEVYSKIVDGDYKDVAFKSFVEAFIKDAKRHGVDLSHVNIEGAKMQWWDESVSPGSYLSCDPTEVYLRWSSEDWKNAKLTDKNILKLKTMWHELGHDILGLTHVCEGGQIMSGRHTPCKGPDGEREWTTLHNLTFTNADPYYDFQRAVDDMFAGVKQEFVDCRSTITSKGITPNLIID